MKNIFKITYPLLALLFAFVGCNEEPEYYTLDTPSDQMHLKASSDNIILEKANELNDVITFTWDEATERDTDGDMVYYFRMYHSAMHDLQSELVRINNDDLSISWTTRELNNLLKAWNIRPGNVATVEAEVLAVIENSSKYLKPEISTTKFNVLGYDPSNKLYLTIETDNQKRSVQMNYMGNDIYTWVGELNENNFWFVRNTETGTPAYFKGEEDNTLVYSNEVDGNKFQSNRLGSYEITLDLAALSINVNMTPINRLYLITSKDGTEVSLPMTEVTPGSDIYYMKDVFEEGTEFRFARYDNTTWPAYTKGDNDNTLEMKDEGAEMFRVNATANYVMTVNISNMSIIFLDVYSPPTGVVGVVGDAVSAIGWNSGAAVENARLIQTDLVNRPEVISYTGQFAHTPGAANQFKFVGDSHWGNGLFATVADANPFDSNHQDVSADGDGDRKWQLPDTFVSGTYTLELNLHTMKLNMVQQ